MDIEKQRHPKSTTNEKPPTITAEVEQIRRATKLNQNLSLLFPEGPSGQEEVRGWGDIKPDWYRGNY